LHYCSKNTQIFNTESGALQVTIATAIPVGNPTLPLRGLDLRTHAGHGIVHILVGILRRNWICDVHLGAIHEHCHPTIGCKLCLDVCFPLPILFPPAPITIAISVLVWPRMPGRLRDTITVVLNNIHFHARRLALALNITIVGCFEVTGIWRDSVKIVVHARVCSACVHVKLNIPTKQIEGLSSMHAPAPCHRPPRTIPVCTVELKIIL